MPHLPHDLRPIPHGERYGEDYCSRCRLIEPSTSTCASHPDAPRVMQPPVVDIRPGDIIELSGGDPGPDHVPESLTVHAVHPHVNGCLTIRFRFTLNPRGLDWHGFIDEHRHVRLLSRGVASVDADTRSLLP